MSRYFECREFDYLEFMRKGTICYIPPRPEFGNVYQFDLEKFVESCWSEDTYGMRQ